MRLNQPEMVDDDLRIRIAADQLDALVEPPGNVQVDRHRQTRGLLEHAVEARIGGVLGKSAAHQQHAHADRARRALPVGDDFDDGRVGGIDRLHQREPVRITIAHLDRIACVVAVHRERRHQDRAVDAGGVQHRDRLIARGLGRPGQYGVPRPGAMITLVGMQLRVDDRHVGLPAVKRITPHPNT